MPLKTIRSKVEQASKKLEALMHKARKARSDCVLVVYEQQEASIYYEGEHGAPKPR